MPVSAARDATWFTWGDAQKKTFAPVKQAIDYQPWEKNQPMGLKKQRRAEFYCIINGNAKLGMTHIHTVRPAEAKN